MYPPPYALDVTFDIENIDTTITVTIKSDNNLFAFFIFITS